MKCSSAKRCGGCPYISIKYEEQGIKKREQVIELLKKANIRLVPGPVHLARVPAAYRNKVIVGFAKDKQKHVFSGLYAAKSHTVVNTAGCQMHPKIVNEIIDEITALVDSMKIQLYSPKTGTGLLRHVLIRYGAKTGQIMIVFVTTKREFPSRKNLVNALIKKFPQITTIVQNINSRDTSIVMQDQTMVLYGKGTITDELCGLKITLSPSSFYQINHDQCEVLYNLAKEMLELKPTDKVLDTYCGAGTIGLFMADACKSVTGVERNLDAVVNARWNAKQNNVENIRFVGMDSTQFMSEARRMHQQYDAIILDPPRAGTTPEFIKSATALKPQKILYISCDPTTQVRDLRLFIKNGYTPVKMELVDMFPNTDAIESIVLLTPSKKKPLVQKEKERAAAKAAKEAPVQKKTVHRKKKPKRKGF
jgi:23S rRNA (uracil1939-C5)-methyltransferase